MSDFETRMRKRGYKEFLGRMLKGLTLSCLMALAIYLLLTVLFADAVEDNKANGGSDTLPLILLQAAYLIAAYAFYVRHEVRELYIPPSKKPDAQTILREYINSGGWILPVVFGVAAVAAEAILLLKPGAVPPHPVVFVSILNMPLIGAIPVPILRAVIGYAVSVGGILLMTVLARKKRE